MSDKITLSSDGSLQVPDRLVLPFIEGDGVGPEVWKAARLVIDASVEKAYRGARAITWKYIYAG